LVVARLLSASVLDKQGLARVTATAGARFYLWKEQKKGLEMEALITEGNLREGKTQALPGETR